MKDMVVVKFAIYALRPNAKWKFGENDTIVWLDEKQTEPTDKEINDWIKDTQYQRDRADAYPSITDVIVALAEKEEGDDTMWKEVTALRVKVKSDNPKPT